MTAGMTSNASLAWVGDILDYIFLVAHEAAKGRDAVGNSVLHGEWHRQR
jgi:hypothetical protein